MLRIVIVQDKHSVMKDNVEQDVLMMHRVYLVLVIKKMTVVSVSIMESVLETAVFVTRAKSVEQHLIVLPESNVPKEIVYRLLTLLSIVEMECYKLVRNAMTVIVLAMMAVVVNAS